MEFRPASSAGIYPRTSCHLFNICIAFLSLLIIILVTLAIIFLFGNVRIAGQYQIVISACVPHISEAIGVVREEQNRIKTEKNRFKRFMKQLTTMEPAPQRSTTSGTTDSSLSQVTYTSDRSYEEESTNKSSLRAVRKAYRETVMDSLHYEQDYGESLEQHIAMELGPELAQSVTNKGDLFQQLQKELLQQSRRCCHERTVLLQSINKELDSITDSKRTIRNIQKEVISVEDSLYPASILELVDRWNQLETLENDITGHLRQRQSKLHAGWGGMPPHALQNYLYQSQPWTYPVLIDSLEAIKRTNRVRDQVVEHIYNW